MGGDQQCEQAFPLMSWEENVMIAEGMVEQVAFQTGSVHPYLRAAEVRLALAAQQLHILGDKAGEVGREFE